MFCLVCFLLTRRRPPRSTRTDTLLPYPTRFRSIHIIGFLDFGEDVGHLAPTVSEECLGVLLAATAKRLHEPQQELRGDGNLAHLGNLVLDHESSAGER